MNKEEIKKIFSIRRLSLILADTLIIAIAWTGMIIMATAQFSSLKINGEITVAKILTYYLIIMLLRMCFHIYNSIWRYANVKVYLKLIISDILASALYFALGRFFLDISIGFAYTLIVGSFIIILTLVSRYIYQYTYTFGSNRESLHKKFFEGKNDNTKDDTKSNVAIVGAGNVGASLADEFINNPHATYKPICFVDTDKNKIGGRLNGLHIYGESADTMDALRSLDIHDVIIALPELSVEDRRRLYHMYSKYGFKVKIYDYITSGEGSTASNTVREIRIEDLLFRSVKDVKTDEIRNFYSGKICLITGGGGSIGSEVCRQIAKLSPKQLIIVDIYENNAYEIQQELKRIYGEKLDVRTIIASVRDVNRMEEIFAYYKPQIVFHAAAHKHVPLMEKNSCEAVKNNVFGTFNVANMAEKYGVENFLLISTDKAVNPTNIMGATKRLCEMIINCRQDSKTKFCAVRFGNVLGSNGSVIPLFAKQIAAGGPITITDKRIIRYFMTISEAVGLVMETCAMAKNGDLYVLDMGNPVKILDLAENMIRLNGLEPYVDIDIKEIGLRPGEKLYEELLMKTDSLTATVNSMIFIERDDVLSRDTVNEKLNILASALDEKNASSEHGYRKSVLAAIRKTVPTYRDPEVVNSKVAE